MGWLNGMFNGKSKEERQQERAWSKNDAQRKAAFMREQELRECHSALEECREKFELVIERERSAVRREMTDRTGAPEPHIKRLKTASVGLLVTRDAQKSLQNIREEGDNNETVNKLSSALKLYSRISDRSIQIGGAFGRRIEDAYERESELVKGIDGVELPQRIADVVDDNFIKQLVEGSSFDECLRRPQENSGQKYIHISMDDIAADVGEREEISTDDYAAILRGTGELL